MSNLTLREAFTNHKFILVDEMLKENPSSYKELNNWDQNYLVTEALKQKSFSTIFTLIGEKLVETDVFELDSFSGSFIETVLANISFYSQPISAFNYETIAKEEPNEEALNFLEKFASAIENIDETISNTTILKWALIKKLPAKAIEILINKGCKVNEIDASENSMLHLDLPEEYFGMLINYGLNVNHKNRGNVTPLQKAIDAGNKNAVRILLENGADAQHKDNRGNSMFYMALVDKINYEIYDLLCEFDNPNFDETNTDGASMLFEYIRRIDGYFSENSLKYLAKLLEQGADLTHKCLYYGSPTTPLDMAITKPFALFEVVLNYLHADVNEQDDNGNTLLHKVCNVNLNFEAEKAKDIYRKAKLLLEKGADVSIRNAQDKLPLDLASNDNLKEKTVKLLMS
ncbi:ankyrin repeat domain-containing protein [Pedobacter sp. SL55]|uniref:ankyrin repeat domain-containing protein n=1 Tax=Pedobacter sp. SL55 TaxID=2995161 RepID=UPI002270DE48|nr:ankyrin repeat domain-containing protein [Pedobacter sp. SL55]WAC42562.1 ankyrin repeat domain-containing protein [Pedobacter sp. SL55]